uniref:Uncharacterized protein n=1 Tax=Anguilla anguilla TaxID=7936 RepID=A0A0E9WXG3_ANGAN
MWAPLDLPQNWACESRHHTHTRGNTPPNSYFPEHKPHTSGNIPDIPQYLASTSQEHLDHVSPIRNVTDTIHTIWASTTLGQSTLLRSMLDAALV